MFVALGSKHLQFSQRNFAVLNSLRAVLKKWTRRGRLLIGAVRMERILWFFSAFFLVQAAEAMNLGTSGPMHATGDREVIDRKAGRVELNGHARVVQGGESLTADRIVIDQKAKTLDAEGNCVYVLPEMTIYGEEMHFNTESRTGSIVSGRISNRQFTLAGERINKLGEGRFQTHWGEYSTCRDCPQSWTFQAEDVDLEINGYAWLSRVTLKIKDVPAAWFPYLIVPIKTKRQSGVLFPSLSLTDQFGFAFVLPYFWAINPHSDMTLGLGHFTSRGPRLEWEGRYVLGANSSGRANAFFLLDKAFCPGRPLNDPSCSGSPRWAVDIQQAQELPWGIQQRLRLSEVSDNLYPVFIGDIRGRGEPVLPSDLYFSYSGENISAYLALRRFRNLLNTSSDPVKRDTQLDPKTVQVTPAIALTTNDHFFFDRAFAAGLTVGHTRFARDAGSFDYDNTNVPIGTEPGPTAPGFQPGVDPLRKGSRFVVTPSVYSVVRPWELFSLTPSLKYYGMVYQFDEQTVGPLYRGYLLFQADFNAQLERVFSVTPGSWGSSYSKLKHLIRPRLTYSLIPKPSIREDSNHPFLTQIRTAQQAGRTGYNFDSMDIIPLENTQNSALYFPPLGHSISYGFTTQLLAKDASASSSSSAQMAEFTAEQYLDLSQFSKPASQRQIFSRFVSGLSLNFGSFSSTTSYQFEPYVNRPPHLISTQFSYVIERATRQMFLAFDRSLSLNYTYNRIGCDPADAATFEFCGTSNLGSALTFSLNDTIMPTLTASYSFITKQLFDAGLKVMFQSLSQCWRFGFALNYRQDIGFVRAFDFSFNLIGSGFAGIGDYASQVAGAK
jgi:LPS-assembly protein